MAANKLIKWKPGKTGLYGSHVMGKSDWAGLGFDQGDDQKPVVFNRDNNFTIVGDDLSFAQLDFFESNADYEIKESEATEVKESKSAAATRAAVTGQAGASAPKTVDVGSKDA